MFALVKNQQVVKFFAPYTIFEDKDGIQYSPDTLINWSASQRQDAGIYDVAYQSQADGRFYNVVEDEPTFDQNEKVVKVTYTSTAREMEDAGESKGLKSQWVAQFNDTANKMLAATDWMLVRKLERNVDIPADTVANRAAVLTECNRLTDAVAAATTVEELVAVVNSANWPVVAV